MRAASCSRKGICTSMTDEAAPDREQPQEKPAARLGRALSGFLPLDLFAARSALSPILPARSIAGRALVLVIVIMTFLAGLTAGAVHLIADASSDWSRSIAREVTLQIRPMPGRDIEADVRMAADLAKRVRGVEAIRVFDRQEGEKLLEPWLGSGLDLGELPVPRLVVIKFGSGAAPDLSALKAELAERVPNAGLDDHRLWLGRLKVMANTLVLIGVIILALVLVATGLAASKGAARRTIAEGGVSVNNVKVTTDEWVPAPSDFLFGRWLVLRRGKRNVAGVHRVGGPSD